MGDTGRKMAKGAAWMVALRFSVRSIGLLNTVILARLLMPADFGLVALATAFVAVLDLFAAFSFQDAIIQNRNAMAADYDTAWTLNLILAFVVAFLLSALAVPVADFYDRPELVAILICLAVGNIIYEFGNIGTVNFQKNLEFDKEFKLAVLQKLAMFLVVVPTALVVRDYRALIAGIIASQLMRTVASYVMQPYRPSLSLSRWRELVRFSRWLLANNILRVFRHRSADFIIGKVAGAGQMGVFSVAYEISNLATTELAAPVERALFAGYSKIAHKPDELRDSYLRVVGLVALLGLPAALGISATASHLVPVLLGDQWLDAVEVVEILALAAGISILATSAGSVCTAMGRPYWLVPLGAIYVVILVPALLVLVPGQASLGAAKAFLLAAAVSAPVQIMIAARQVGVGVSVLVRVLWRPAVAAGSMYFCLTHLSALEHSPGELGSMPGYSF